MNFLSLLRKNNSFRNRFVSLLLLLFVFRVLCFIPLPWVQTDLLKNINNSGLMLVLDTFSGSSFKNFTLMATGISSYVGASIILQLLSFFSPSFKELHKSPDGKKQLLKYTIVLGVIFAFISSIGTTIIFQKHYGVLTQNSWQVYIIIALLNSFGTFLAIIIGEKITKLKFGNGCSILIFTNILLSVTSIFMDLISSFNIFTGNYFHLFIFIFGFFGICLLVVLLETSKKNLPLQRSQTTVRTTFKEINITSVYTIRTNLCGVMPIIFALTIFQCINLIGDFIPSTSAFYIFITTYLNNNSPFYLITTSILIFIFSFIYSSLIFDPKDINESLQAQYASFPNIRLGHDTEKYLAKIRFRLTLISACFISLILVIATLFFDLVGISTISATSIMVMISVGMEIFNSIKADMALQKAQKHFFE